MKPLSLSHAVISSTADYEQFESHEEQASMRETHIRKLMQSMTKNGFVPAKAIHVYRKGGKLIVIDGHHRLEAARRLGIEVYYIIGSEAERDFIGDGNVVVRKWSGADFLSRYVKRGLRDYIILDQYVKDGFPMNKAASLLGGESAGSGNAGRRVQDGTFKVKTTEAIDMIRDARKRLKPVNNETQSKVFIDALSALLLLEHFDLSTLIQRIESNPRMLGKCATRDQMCEALEEIYNFRAREKVSLAFPASEILKRRKLTFGRNKDQ